MPFSIRLLHTSVLVVASTLAACASAGQPRLERRLPYRVALQPVTLRGFPDKTPPSNADGDLIAPLKADSLTAQVRESLLGVFQEVDVVQASATTQDYVDLVLQLDLQCGNRIRSTGDGWLLSSLCFVVGSPIGWFVRDRSYEFADPAKFTGTISLRTDSREKDRIKLQAIGKPAATTFLDRADSVAHYMSSLILPTVLLASESESVKLGLPNLLGKNLADGLAREVMDNAQKLQTLGSSQFWLSRFETNGADGSFVFAGAINYKRGGSDGLDVEWRPARGDWKPFMNKEIKNDGEYPLILNLTGVRPDGLFQLRIKEINGSQPVVRTYTFRAPKA